ncbi:MAG TPA: hypothetical protein VEV38_09370 [Candidatus Eremiobacteraceae bacterium]|nr:hypothetical protein [Candidatus Eremiobacteraceae bacterium]
MILSTYDRQRRAGQQRTTIESDLCRSCGEYAIENCSGMLTSTQLVAKKAAPAKRRQRQRDEFERLI